MPTTKQKHDAIRYQGERDFKDGKPIEAFEHVKGIARTELERGSYENGWRGAKEEARQTAKRAMPKSTAERALDMTSREIVTALLTHTQQCFVESAKADINKWSWQSAMLEVLLAKLVSDDDQVYSIFHQIESAAASFMVNKYGCKKISASDIPEQLRKNDAGLPALFAVVIPCGLVAEFESTIAFMRA